MADMHLLSLPVRWPGPLRWAVVGVFMWSGEGSCQVQGFDFGALMESARAMQEEVARAQASLADRRATGTAGGGLVTAEVDGNGQLVGLVIDPSVVDPDDVETLADLVIAAVRDGARQAEAVAQQAMSAVAGGLAGGLPGLGGALGLPGAVGGAPGAGAGAAPGGVPDLAGLLDHPDDPEA